MLLAGAHRILRKKESVNSQHDQSTQNCAQEAPLPIIRALDSCAAQRDNESDTHPFVSARSVCRPNSSLQFEAFVSARQFNDLDQPTSDELEVFSARSLTPD